jgi:hypothetical protein
MFVQRTEHVEDGLVGHHVFDFFVFARDHRAALLPARIKARLLTFAPLRLFGS